MNNSTGNITTIGALSGDATSVLGGSESGSLNQNVIGGLNTSTTFAGVVGGTSTGLALTKVGKGTLSLTNSGDNYTNGTIVNQGTLTATAAGGFGTGNITVTPTVATGTVTDSATLNSNGSIGSAAIVTVNNEAGDGGFGVGTVNLNDTAPTIAALAGNGNAVLNSGTTTALTLGTTGTTTTTFTGIISQSAGTVGSLTKTGTNTQAVTSANNYSGGTTINNGSLLISNTTGSATGSGSVSITPSGGTVFTPVTAALSGTGISTGALTATSSANNIAVLAPGVNAAGSTHGGTVGAMTVGKTGGMSLSNAALDYDLSAAGDTATNTPNAANDTIVTGGTLNLNGGALAINFNEVTANTLATTTAYTLISGFTGAPGFNAGAITTTFSGGTGYAAVYNLVPISGGATNNLTVQFAPAPEPGQTATMGLIALGMGGLFLRARKRRRSEKLAV